MLLPTRDELSSLARKLEDPPVVRWNDFTIRWEDFLQTEKDWVIYQQLYLFVEELSKLTNNESHYNKIFGFGIIRRETAFNRKLCISYPLYDKNKKKYGYMIVPLGCNLYKTVICGSVDTKDLVDRGLLIWSTKSAHHIYNEYINLLSDCEDV